MIPTFSHFTQVTGTRRVCPGLVLAFYCPHPLQQKYALTGSAFSWCTCKLPARLEAAFPGRFRSLKARRRMLQLTDRR